VSPEIIHHLPAELRAGQATVAATGGLHAVAGGASGADH